MVIDTVKESKKVGSEIHLGKRCSMNVKFVTLFPLLFTQSLLHSFMCTHAYFYYTLVTSSAEDKKQQNIFPRVSDTQNNFVCRLHLIWVEVVYLSDQP